MLLLDIFMFIGLDFRDPPAVTRLTVYCWLHTPAQGDRDPGRLEHLWNQWMHVLDFLGSGLSELIAVRNGHGEWVYLATCKAVLPYIH